MRGCDFGQIFLKRMKANMNRKPLFLLGAQTFASVILIALSFPIGVRAQPRGHGNAPSNKSSLSAKDTAVQAHEFVQKFYNWYVPFSAHSKTLACKEVLNAHPEYFSKALYPMLKKNIADMERTHGLGLGFDPFLNSQDPSSKYVVGPADGTDEGYAMKVYSAQDGRKQSEPDVIAVVENQHNSWVLTNFHYPNQGTSLRQLLRAQNN
jgi:hypothetical protein